MDAEQDLSRKSCMVTIPHKAMNRGVDITPVSNTETAQKVRHDGQTWCQHKHGRENREKWYTEIKKNKKDKVKTVTHGEKPEGRLLFKFIHIENSLEKQSPEVQAVSELAYT